MTKPKVSGLSLLTIILATATAQAHYEERADVQQFINNMVSKYQYDRTQLTYWLEEVVPQTAILETIAKPAESKTWKDYRPIFLTNDRIQQGVTFWKNNREVLLRAQQQFGVPAEIIVAIIGVETFYGKRSGNYLVLDSLTTLGFDYAPRAEFFRKELEQYLLMVRDEKINPLEMRGSYAGAMGMPQFIPSSFRTFAIDFDGDGKRDLWTNTADVVGSVANYFKVNGWQAGEPVISRASVTGIVADLVTSQIKPAKTVAEYKLLGATPIAAFSEKAAATLLQFDGASGAEYWMGLDNFYVITRYNRSPLYAMAVFQLSQALSTEYSAVL